MSFLRFPRHGLFTKLTLLYVGLALLALALVKWTLQIVEFAELKEAIAKGSMAAAVTEAAALLDSADRPTAPAPSEIEAGLETLLLRMQQPHGRLALAPSNILSELAQRPLDLVVVERSGRTLASAADGGNWQAHIDSNDSLWNRTENAKLAKLLFASDSPLLHRRFAALLRERGDTPPRALLVELRLPLPWQSFSATHTDEWPMLLGYLLLFGLGSAVFFSRSVTRRLDRIGAAADAWSRGDFEPMIVDARSDELGALSVQLNRMANDLRALVQTRARLATAEERQRLARDLHDTVKQKAFALQLQLAAASRQLVGATPGALTRVEEARRIAEEIQTELTEILDELRVHEAGEAFSAQIAQRANDWARRSSIALHLRLNAADDVPVAYHDTLLRIVDEGLANVLRHSGATTADLDLVRLESGFALNIIDDGGGAAADHKVGMGLANMRQRSASLPGGRFEFSSRPGGGASVTVTWLLSNESNL